MKILPYDNLRDKEAIVRIWRETGWLEKNKEEGLYLLANCGRSYVALLEGEAESLVISIPGTLRYLKEDLSMAGISGVTTSRIARQQGLARYLTAKTLAQDALEGTMVGVLGMFEQGFYNGIGFGTGGYEHWISFDPARLKIDNKPRIPKRLTLEDWNDMHSSIFNRFQAHGVCNLNPPERIKGEILLHGEDSFGLGYYNESGDLTHHFFCVPKEVEDGPYHISWLVFRNYTEFLELMALLKSLGDQVRLIRIREPRGIQFQDLIDKPFHQHFVSQGSKFPCFIRASAYWQMRILNLEKALSHTKLLGDPVSFNLQLKDPIASLLVNEEWKGIGGDYVVTLGPSSGATRGHDKSLPTLQSSVGAFSRLWLGTLPARGLAVTDDLQGPEDLLEDLERIIKVPYPSPDLDF